MRRFSVPGSLMPGINEEGSHGVVLLVRVVLVYFPSMRAVSGWRSSTSCAYHRLRPLGVQRCQPVDPGMLACSSVVHSSKCFASRRRNPRLQAMGRRSID